MASRAASSAPTLSRPRHPGGRPPRPIAFRPACPDHPGTVRLEGHRADRTGYHSRPLYRCFPHDTTKPHRLSLTPSIRRPTLLHPHFGDRCPHCEHQYSPHEGEITPRNFTFSAHEIAGVLADLGNGESYREAGRRARGRAWRKGLGRTRISPPRPPGKPPLPPRVRNRTWANPTTFISGEANLALNYVDNFAPVVMALYPRERWPDVLLLDSMPLMKRRWREGKKIRGGEPAGHVLIAVDGSPGKNFRPFLMRVAGNNDAAAWRAFFRLYPGDPTWIVSDQDAAIKAAVAAQWPQAVHFNCEGHLTKNAKEAAAADGLTPYADQVGMDLFAAINFMLSSRKRWVAFKTLVSNLLPERTNLPAFIANNDATVLRQAPLRWNNPGRPRGAGPVEAYGETMKRAFRFRTGPLRNATRLNRVLDLMTLRFARLADPEVYAGLIRKQIDAQGGFAGADWTASLERKNARRSLDRLLIVADARRLRKEAQDKGRSRARAVS
jgi:hypothetical protein